ncbi:MAG TPA: hypothetical protein DD729_09800 [Rhodobacteraceae bacterium]|nr:hypothetical protein [Paracoccaceae bacterium]
MKEILTTKLRFKSKFTLITFRAAERIYWQQQVKWLINLSNSSSIYHKIDIIALFYEPNKRTGIVSI